MPPEALCVYCRRRKIDPAWMPFCSERCKMADLGRWLSGDYRLPSNAGEADPDVADVIDPPPDEPIDD